MGAHNTPSIGIDFGTANSRAARYSVQDGRAEIVPNAEGEGRTPSAVYFGDGRVLVGRAVEATLEKCSDLAQRRAVQARVVSHAKRLLQSQSVIHVPGRGDLRPAEVAAEILRKLRRDAERRLLGREIVRAVITCPVSFDPVQRRKLAEAATLAGFREVELLEEPVAAAAALSRQGGGAAAGRVLIVYDLGGGSFDLACVVQEEDGEFRLALEPDGDDRCGGDDFDQALYDHCDGRLRKEQGRPLCPSEGDIDLRALGRCRELKEQLTETERAPVHISLAGDKEFRPVIDRQTFNGLVRDLVEKTARKTAAMIKRASDEGLKVDGVVLVGGGSRIPLVREVVRQAVGVEVLAWERGVEAAALGAAHRAHAVWGEGAGASGARKKPRGGPENFKPDARENQQLLQAREAGAQSSSDWAFCARLWAAGFDNRNEAIRCLRQAERRARGLADWLECAAAWGEAIDADLEAMRCFNQAITFARGVPDWVACADYSLRVFPDSPAARQFMTKAESVADNPAEMSFCDEHRRRLFGGDNGEAAPTRLTDLRGAAPAAAAIPRLRVGDSGRLKLSVGKRLAVTNTAPDGAVLQVLKKHEVGAREQSRVSLHVYPRIPQAKLDGARERLGVRPNEFVLGLLDLSLLGTVSVGVAFGREGAYFKLSTSSPPGAFPYDALGKLSFTGRADGEFSAVRAGDEQPAVKASLRPEAAALLCDIFDDLKGAAGATP